MSNKKELEEAIHALEAQRTLLGDAVVDASIGVLREKLGELLAKSRQQQRKQVTIMFVDTVGSMSLGEKLDPEEVLDLMNTALTAFVKAVQHHQGEIARLTGDGLLAFFGARQTRENDPERAIQASLEIRDVARNYGGLLAEKGVPGEFAVRIGINTGLVALGEVGAEGGSEFTAMGDPINLASRLEGSAPPNGIVISQETYRHVKGLFEVQNLEPLQVKGKSEPVQSYLVIKAVPDPLLPAVRGVEEIDTRLIGREIELMTLNNRFQEILEEDEPVFMTVVGDAGIGKSRLLEEFIGGLEEFPGRLSVFKGRATPAIEPVPYGLIRDLFVRRCQILETDAKPDVMRKIRGEMDGILPAERADLVAHFIGFDFSDSSAVRPLLGSPDFKQLAVVYLIAYLKAVIQHPTVILLEDVHWADDSSLDLVARLFGELSQGRLLAICLCRPMLYERRPDWGDGFRLHEQLSLKALSRRSSRLLLQEIGRRVEHMPAAFSDRIIARAEGNPFFLEELIKLMLDKGYIERGDPHWRVVIDDIEQLPVPSTLMGVLHARFDLLSAAEKVILQRASVVGRVFWDAVLVELTDDVDPAPDVASELANLSRRNMIVPQGRSSIAAVREYSFKNALLRDAVYETVLLKPRRRYHGVVARWLERHLGERIVENLSLIAQHFEMAGELDLAADYLGRSGRLLLRTGAVRESQQLLRRALTLLPAAADQATRGKLMINLGNAFSKGGDLIEAEQVLRDGLALASQSADERLQSRALSYLGEVTSKLGHYGEAEAYDSEALALARELGDLEQIAMTLHGLSTTTYLREKIEESQTYANEALACYRQLGDQRGEARVLNQLGLMLETDGRREEQIAYYEHSLAIFQEIGDLAGGAVVLNNLGSNAYLHDDFDSAVDYTQQALAILEELGQTFYIAFTLVSLGLAHAARGELGKARTCHCRALATAQTIHSEQVTLFALVGLADYYSLSEQPVAGTELLGFIFNHPAVTRDIRKDAKSAEARLRQALSALEFEQALSRGAGKTQDGLIQFYLEACADRPIEPGPA